MSYWNSNGKCVFMRKIQKVRDIAEEVCSFVNAAGDYVRMNSL